MKRSSVRMASRSKKQKSKYPIPFSHAIVTGIVLVLMYVVGIRGAVQQKKLEEENTKPITITFVGDIMFDRGVKRNIEKHFDGDYKALFANASYLKETDITFGNLEGPVADTATGRNVGSSFSFRMDPKGLDAMKEAGFDIVSFANNHVGDYSQAAFEETLKNLTKRNILFTGAGENKEKALTPTIFTIRGVTIGFLASTDVGPTWMKATDKNAGTVISDDPAFWDAIAKADKEVDVLIISMHWGQEYAPPSDREKKFAKKIIDLGGDIVVGHHPHVMQKMEMYKDKPIFYSLGNYIFDQYFSSHTLRGMVGMVRINPATKTISQEAYITPMNRQFIPQALIPYDESLLVQKAFYP